jgi:hypothetical protein
MPALPLGTALPALGARANVEFEGLGAFVGVVTAVKAGSFVVHFEQDNTDAEVTPSKHRYRLLPPLQPRTDRGPKRKLSTPAPTASSGRQRTWAPAAAEAVGRPATSTRNEPPVPASSTGPSAYELARQRKIAANEAMLRQLGLIGAGSITHAMAAAARPKPALPRTPKPAWTPKPAGELRRSGRDKSATGELRYDDGRRPGHGRYTQHVELEESDRRRRVYRPVDESVLCAAEQTAGAPCCMLTRSRCLWLSNLCMVYLNGCGVVRAGASTGETFTKVMTPSMVEYRPTPCLPMRIETDWRFPQDLCDEC